jgi:hypothetical protein
MLFRTIKRTGDTGGLDRDRVREAVIRLRDRKRAAAALPGYVTRPSTGVLVARERPISPYGQPGGAPEALPGEGDGEER